METIESRLTVGDVLRYLLAYALWIALSAASGALILLLREPIRQVTALIAWRDPHYQMYRVEASGLINTVDRFGLLILAILWVVYVIFAEEDLRTSIAKVRERRLRASLSAPEDRRAQPMSRLQRLGLDLFVCRLPRLVAVPAVLLGLHLVLFAVIQVLLRL